MVTGGPWRVDATCSCASRWLPSARLRYNAQLRVQRGKLVDFFVRNFDFTESFHVLAQLLVNPLNLQLLVTTVKTRLQEQNES